MQTSPRNVMVPSPTAGMRAPFASTNSIGQTLMWSLGITEHSKCNLRRLVDDLQQGARRTARRPLALLPVAHGLDRHPDAGGKFGLREFGAGTNASSIG